MVNTFLVHANFNISASWLDSRRLGKQRVEAYQILTLLEDLNELSHIFNLPAPIVASRVDSRLESSGTLSSSTESVPIKDWIKAIATRYKKLPYYYVRKNNMMIRIDKSKTTEERVIKLGFVHHPAVRMWVGYEYALKGIYHGSY